MALSIGNGLISSTANLTFSASDMFLTDATGAIKLPIGNTAQRPPPAIGIIRWNTDEGLEVSNSTTWFTMGLQPLGNNLERSLRFRASASAYLSRSAYPVASAGTKWTMSLWVKRGTLSVVNDLFSFVATTGAAQQAGIQFNADNCIRWWQYAPSTYQFHKITTAVFRDPAAWYHLVFVYDTTLATAEDRCQVWVNGVRQTAFSTNTNPSLNLVTYYKTGQLYPYIGAENRNNTYLNGFDGYLADVNFIDGQALTPASFGLTNATTGVWQPARYTGTYGTNGFYLKFTDNSTAAALGTDFSGNSNTWTVNNISVTAGVTYDSMTDVPTLTNATTANYAVLNPISNLSTNSTVTNGNLQVATVSSGDCSIPATIGMKGSGKYYAEFVWTASGTSAMLGIIPSTYASGTAPGYNANSAGYRTDGLLRNSGASTSSWGATWVQNDVMAIAFDAGAGTIEFYKNNVKQGSTLTGFTTDTYFFAVGEDAGAASATWVANFGQRPFAYTPPTGFVALNTYNLPTASILDGAEYFNAVLWTGNGTTQSIDVGFQPDFVWHKTRSTANNHILLDSVRGEDQILYSNLTNAEATRANSIALTPTGYTLEDNWSNRNGAGITYVGWNWKAGGAAVTNTAGTISAQVSANPTAGFSVVTYSATGSNATVGHGLGVAPSMVIFKVRNQIDGWGVYHRSIGSTYVLLLDSTSAQQGPSASYFNSTSPSSSVISLGTWSRLNNTGGTYVAYCFAEIDGFSKFGRYTGNGSTDGAFIYTGFRPRFVMVKQTNNVGNWIIWDTSRSTYNQMQLYLVPNSSSQELNNAVVSIDALSNGFKCRTTDNDINGSGDSYIYAAFAENPFKNSLAQ